MLRKAFSAALQSLMEHLLQRHGECHVSYTVINCFRPKERKANVMKNTHFFYRFMTRLIFVTCAVVLVTGCNKSDGSLHLGVDIPANAETVTLASIIDNPVAYNGKHVVLKGTISGQCPALCEFFLQDGIHRATIFPQGYKFPKLTAGKPVTVYAQVTSGQGQVVFSALGVRVEERRKT